MMSPRSRVAIFISGITLLTVLVQWNGLPYLLDSLLGGIAWSSGIVDFLKKNTQGLIVFILLSIFFEWSGLRQSVEDQRREHLVAHSLIAKSIRSSSGLALVETGLESLYGPDAARSLAHKLIPRSDVLHNFSVRIVVSKESHDRFLVESTLTYRTTSRQFLVATSTNPLHVEAVLATGRISEAFNVQAVGEGVPATIQRIDEDVNTGVRVAKDLTFQEITGRRKRNLFNSTGLQIDLNDFKVFEALPTPSRSKSISDNFTYQISYKDMQAADMKYTYWISDRVLHLSSIEVDLRGLGPEIYQKARLHRFLASSQWPSTPDILSGRCLIPLDTWCVSGDGVVVVWLQG